MKIFYTLPRGGCHLIQIPLSRYAFQYNMRFKTYEDFENDKLNLEDIDILHVEGFEEAHFESFFTNQNKIKSHKSVLVLRHPFDTIVSAYHHYNQLPKSEPWLWKIHDLGCIPAEVIAQKKSDFVFYANLLSWQWEKIASYIADPIPNQMVVRFENLVNPKTYKEQWLKIESCLELPNLVNLAQQYSVLNPTYRKQQISRKPKHVGPKISKPNQWITIPKDQFSKIKYMLGDLPDQIDKIYPIV